MQAFNKIDKTFLIKSAIFFTLCIEVTSVPLGIYFPVYGNVIGFIFLTLLLIDNIKYSVYAVFLIISIFLFYFIINYSYYINSIEPYKALAYSIIALLLSLDFIKRDYKIILEDVFFKYLIFIAFAFIIGIGIDDAGGSKRIQGFLSEPSALSLILCFLFWTYLKEKKYKKLIFIIIITLMTLSLVVYAQLFLFYIINLLININFKTFIKLIFISLVLFTSLLIISNSDSDFWLIRKASDAVVYSLSNGTEGKNTRAVDLDKLNEEQKNNSYSYLFGNGPNYLVYYYGTRDLTATTQNMQSIIYFNFGLIGCLVAIVWVLYTAFKLKNSVYYILFLSTVSYSLINTASGIVNDIYLYALLFYSARLLFSVNFKHKVLNTF